MPRVYEVEVWEIHKTKKTVEVVMSDESIVALNGVNGLESMVKQRAIKEATKTPFGTLSKTGYETAIVTYK